MLISTEAVRFKVFSGMTPEEKAFCEGFTQGYEDAQDGLSEDLSGSHWYVKGYRFGYEVFGWDEPREQDEPETLLGLGAA